ncbi:uncharacterized protein LOC126842520 [Adelges cooleyi]|uniref:uncharacterized protein LOC126842520 n=1 Tax=Adelges cooleyi TaxID=133065 RepID=UPI0021805AAA|nr:uncharacterized protein LOC126842520 [Adelges cooleyi]
MIKCLMPELEAVYNDYLALIKPGKTTMEEKWLLGFVGDNKTNLNAIDSYKSEKNFTSEFKSKICVPLFVEYLKIVNKIQNDANHTEKDVVTFAKECLENVKKIQEDLRHHD